MLKKYKQKTKKSLKKRVIARKNDFCFRSVGKRHNLQVKSSKSKRQKRKSNSFSSCDKKNLVKLLNV